MHEQSTNSNAESKVRGYLEVPYFSIADVTQSVVDFVPMTSSWLHLTVHVNTALACCECILRGSNNGQRYDQEAGTHSAGGLFP
jgi:hypothetical protein